MANDPAFLFYPGDFLGGTMTFNNLQIGCYLRLMLAQFNAGPLTESEIKTLLNGDFEAAWPAVQKKFKQNENGLYLNERLSFEILRRKNYTESRKNNIKGNNQFTKKKKDYTRAHTSKHTPGRMENENENRNTIENGNEIKSIEGDKFLKFQAWVNENAPRVNQLKKPFTKADYLKLKDKYSTETITTVLTAMQNKADLTRKYISAYLTAENWCKRENLNTNGKQTSKSKSNTANNLYTEVANFVNKGF